jgi:predicted TIM-barrel fold metal-dependent hydrolase
VVTTVQRGHIAIRRNILEPIGLLTDLIYGKVLENHPRLRFVFAEYELSWLHPFITTMDGAVERSRSESPNAPMLRDLPSECIKRQIYITFQNDPLGVAAAEHLGMVDNYLWASDYPHGGSTWPNSQDIVRAQCEGIPEKVQKKLTWENAAKFYGLD